MPKLLTKDKYLTAYALSCGYLECNKGFRLSGRFDIWLEMDSACYHVKGYDNTLHKRLFWDSFETLKAARKALNEHFKAYGCERKIPKESDQ